MRLVQLRAGEGRSLVALVEEPQLRLLAYKSIYDLAMAAIESRASLPAFVLENVTADVLDYSQIYDGKSNWRLMPPIHHPDGPARTLVSGTGLTHLGSANNRQAMHAVSEENLTDSMKMFRWGMDAGKPPVGQIGIAPEWFYKGSGAVLRAPGEALEVPAFAEGGGEEAEIAGVYLIGLDGMPYRIGMCNGNEFADHKFEKRNYLNLAGSKIRNCAIGPELVIDPEFESVTGEVSIERAGKILWSKSIATGQTQMCHSLANIEHHHFKFENHREPGNLHVHYFGAHSLSFGEGVQLLDGDIMVISWTGFGRALCNPLRVVPASKDKLIQTIPLV